MIDSVHYSPVTQTEWWNAHVEYAKFNRQGVDVLTARFVHPTPRAAVVVLTGWSETFLKYSDFIKALFDQGFSVFTYDHQSQGTSGRWLPEAQSTWVHTFEDYVDDFVYYCTLVSRETPQLPVYLFAHSMGGLVASIAMSRLPALINRAVLSAPMLRNKCGMKVADYKYPLPQPIAYWITYWACLAGLGSLNALGFFKESAADPLKLHITTSDPEQLRNWQLLRQKYPALLATCVTNDWVLQSIRAQKKFSRFYEFVAPNVLVIAADPAREVFVHNRAMSMFVNKAPRSRMLVAPGAFHELLFESAVIRGAVTKTVMDFFSQTSDDVTQVHACSPLQEWDKATPIYSPAESLIRAVGVTVAIVGAVTGLSLILSGGRRD